MFKFNNPEFEIEISEKNVCHNKPNYFLQNTDFFLYLNGKSVIRILIIKYIYIRTFNDNVKKNPLLQ